MLFRAGRRPIVWVMVAAFVCVFATTGSAQTVVDPVTAEFDPSSDHNTVDSSGVALVDYYLLSFYTVGGSTPVMSINLGKPNPDPDGKIRVDFAELMSSLPTPGVALEGRVSAVGWGGSAASSISNQFSFSSPCDPSIGSYSQSMTSAAGSGTVSVTAGTGCPWTSASNASWLTVTGGSSGSGNGTVSFSVSANTGASMRTGILTIAGENFTVSQSGTSCTYSISPTSQTVAAAGGTGTIPVTAGTGCTWSATSSTTWLSVTGGASGTGNGSVTFSALANSLSTTRTGTIVAAGKTFTVTQSASTCAFTVSPLTVSMSSAAGTSSVTVATTASCAWSATDTASWLTISSGTGRTGGGTLSFSVTSNTTGATRSAVMTVAGKTVNVSQSATASITVSPTALNVAANAASSTTAQQITITQGAGNKVSWTVTADKSWLQVSPASGSGAAIVSVSLKPGVALPTTNTSGIVTVTPAGSSFGAKTVAVTFKIISAGAAPSGAVDTPADNTTGVTGSLPVTGWAIDDIDIARVRVLRDPVAPEAPGSLVFIGNAVLVEGARPDIAQMFSTLPHSTRGGWGLLVLTNMFPNQGNGTFRLHAYADDVDGHTVLLGSRTITCTNSTATTPFGAIDTPDQGETISGSSYNNFGWVLSRGTRRADPPGGGNVRVVIDGAFVGSPAGWTKRTDLSTFFPVAQYSGVNTAAGAYTFNTTTLANGVHTIAWVVTDNQGASSGIGSRYFSVLNGGSLMAGLSADEAVAPSASSNSLVIAEPAPSAVSTEELSSTAARAASDPTPVFARRGYSENTPFRSLRANESGLVTVQAEETDRIELVLDPQANGQCSGYSVTAGVDAGLPAGSNLDPSTCTFTWQAGVGFVGSYDFVFMRESADGAARKDVRVVLNPKRSGLVGTQVVIDIPGANQEVGQPFVVAGWAADLDAQATTGVDTLHVWAYPVSGAAPKFVGVAAYGGARPDVAAVYGAQFRESGYGLEVSDLAAGTYDLAVFAWSTVTGGFVPASTVRVTVK